MYDLSIILSTRNRERVLDQTLAGIAGQVADGIKWEIVVVDNGSSDGTPEVLRQWKKSLPLTALEERTPGKNRALNRAVKVASGTLLLFTDDDIIPDRHWIREVCAGAARWPDDAVFGGTIIPRFPAGAPDFLQAEDFSYAGQAYSRWIPKYPEGSVPLTPFGPNWAVYRQALGALTFDERLGPSVGSFAMADETELLIRLHEAGNRFIYLPAAVVEHRIEAHQLKLRWLLGRAVRFGRGLARLEPESTATILFSAPRWRWRQLGRTIAAFARECFRGRQKRWEAAIRIWEIAGMILEFRRMAASNSLGAARSVAVPESESNGILT